jgi:hypothetical protein
VLRTIVLVALCAGFSPGLLAGEREIYTGYTFGKNFDVTISEQDFKNSPAWDQHADNPPLPAQKALKLATAAKDTLVHDSKTWKWRPTELTLTNFGSREDARKWYWAVRYQADHAPDPALSASAGVAPELTVIVRMDGTVVPPAGDGPQERPSSTRTPPPMPKPRSLSETRFVERGLLLHITDAFGITKDVRRPLHSNTLFSHAIGNNRYQIYINDEDLLKAPEWKSDAENPPVSTRKAIRLASQAKETLVKDTPVYNWKFAEAALRLDQTGQRWYWLILFERRLRNGDAEADAPKRLIGVLMDGTVLKPTLDNSP